MGKQDESNAIFYLTFVIIFICGILIWYFSGFNHEVVKVKLILVSFLAVVLVHSIVITPIRFIILAIDAASFPAAQAAVIPDKRARAETLLESLRFRLQMLRSELLITESHRNEELNLKYQTITQELKRMGMLFLSSLLLNVERAEDQWVYFNTANMRSLFDYNHTSTLGLSNAIVLPNIYDFIELSLIIPFTDTDAKSGGSPWVHAEGTRLLGVVRLRQVRTRNRDGGLQNPEFDNEDYSEGWTLPYQRESYTDKFWPIYQPWVSRVPNIQDRIILSVRHRGGFIYYPEITGYENLLCDTRAKSMMVLNYLKDHKWLDLNTSALFMDFTLYSADANLFSVCTLWLEQFPFGGIKTHLKIESSRFLEGVSELSGYGVFTLYFFAITWLIYAKAFWVKVWYEPKQLKNPWMIVDALILILSSLVVVARGVRDNMVRGMIRRVEISVMVDFINFREPAMLSYLCKILEGFSMALITMRLWKAMQFSSTFQLFTTTLFTAKRDLLWTIMVTLIFLSATGTAAVTINGSNAIQFSTVLKGIISLTCFAFGFSSHVEPADLFYGGKCVGIMLYGILAFVVKMLLVNIIVSILENQMAQVKGLRDKDQKSVNSHLTYCQFLRVEYAYVINFFRKFFSWRLKYLPRGRTVAENIQRELNEQRRNAKKSRSTFYIRDQRETDESLIQLRYRERIEKTITITAILQTQMDLIERLMFGDDEGNLPPLGENESPGTSGQNQKTENKQ
ncbi:polycystin-2 [Drosophila serrata]|uniref:polycystin-2 n=1 Tax=Drosophila serrata TaxID=7274 RepID=UPI000A1D0EFE|nr:polycystin-2 [Drosophila serrata]